MMTTMMTLALLAQTETAAPQGQPGGNYFMFVFIAIMCAIFYFAILRPQKRQDAARRKLIEEMTSGARVVFGGGIYGVVREVKDKSFMVEVANGVVIEIARGAVRQVLKDGEAAVVDEK